MVARVVTPAVVGFQTFTVQVEVDLRAGIPGFSVVGLPDTAVQEARERVRSGLTNQAFAVPPRRIVANLAPADLRKAGPHYDLPLALAIACASGQLDPSCIEGVGAVGELGLDGCLRPVAGALVMAEHAARSGWQRLVVPAASAAEAALVEGVEVLGATGLRHAVELLEGGAEPPSLETDVGRLLGRAASSVAPDLADVRGQGAARRAIEVAAAGEHSLLMLGAPGGGKTMLARRLPGLLPPLTSAEAIEVTRIHSVAGLLAPERPLVGVRPFRAPHHTISTAGLVGGGRVPRPGEVSLAHRGVLFLDEVCAFAPSALDALRQPLEEGCIDVHRAMGAARFPASPLLVCAGNPCPCGFLGDATRSCTCPPARAESYRARLSGPVSDRLDLQVTVPRLSREELLGSDAHEPTASVRERVVAAQVFRRERGQDAPNARLPAARVREAASLDSPAIRMLERAIDRLALTARGCDRVLRVARTVADLAAARRVGGDHLAEALGYRVAPTGGDGP
ncbi:MAG: YifB family Mg chelatase-like AAA ATPase [Miltoncostaeaceae bacterium]